MQASFCQCPVRMPLSRCVLSRRHSPDPLLPVTVEWTEQRRYLAEGLFVDGHGGDVGVGWLVVRDEKGGKKKSHQQPEHVTGSEGARLFLPLLLRPSFSFSFSPNNFHITTHTRTFQPCSSKSRCAIGASLIYASFFAVANRKHFLVDLFEDGHKRTTSQKNH